MLNEENTAKTPECRSYTVNDIRAIDGVSTESIRNFIRKHQKNKDFRVHKVGKHLCIDKKSFEDWYENHSDDI